MEKLGTEHSPVIDGLAFLSWVMAPVIFQRFLLDLKLDPVAIDEFERRWEGSPKNALDHPTN